MFDKSIKVLTPNELIQEWDEWEGLPQLPELDEDDVANMDYKSEFQIILNEIQNSQGELTKDQYVEILIFHSRFALFLYQKNVDIANLSYSLCELRNLCIWEENSHKIIAILNTIASFFSEIEKPKINNKTKINNNFQNDSSKRGTNNNIKTINNLPKNETHTNNNINENNTKFLENINNITYSDEKPNSSFYDKKPDTSFLDKKLNTKLRDKRPNTTFPKEKRINQENRFQILSNSNENNPEIYIPDSDNVKDKLEQLLHKLLDVKNGIIDPVKTKAISDDVRAIYDSSIYSDEWYLEVEYFKNRKMIPLEHIVKLRNYIFDME